MREFTKSMLSLSWAMSLFGLKQMAGLFTPGTNTAASFEAVTRCTEDQLGTVTRSTFRTGDSLQRGLVDLTFALFTFGLWQPNRGRGDTGRGGWGSGGWGQCGWGQGDASQPGGWSQGDMGQPGGSTQADTGQPGSGWLQASAQQGGRTQASAGQPGGGWQVGGAGGSSGGIWPAVEGSSIAAAGAETVRSAGEMTAQAMGWGIDMMQQGANAVSQTLGGSSTQQQPMQSGEYQTSGGGSDQR